MFDEVVDDAFKIFANDDAVCNLGDIRFPKYPPLDMDEYVKVEYEDVDIFVMQASTAQEMLSNLETQMDAALLGKDIEWAREIHREIQYVKEKMTG